MPWKEGRNPVSYGNIVPMTLNELIVVPVCHVALRASRTILEGIYSGEE